MNEGAILGVGWQLASGGVLEALDDGGFSRAVASDNESQRCGESEGLAVVGGKGADALERQSVDARHGWWRQLALEQLGGVTRCGVVVLW